MKATTTESVVEPGRYKALVLNHHRVTEYMCGHLHEEQAGAQACADRMLTEDPLGRWTMEAVA